MKNVINMIISRRAFAKRISVSHTAVLKAIEAGRIDILGDGVDLTGKNTREFIVTQKTRLRALRAEAGPRTETAADPDTMPQRFQTERQGKLLKLEAQIRRFDLLNKKQEIENDYRRRELIDRSLAQKYFSRWFQIESSQLYTLADRVGPEIVSIAGVNDSQVALKLVEAIKAETARTVEHLKILVDDLITELASAEDANTENSDDGKN